MFPVAGVCHDTPPLPSCDEEQRLYGQLTTIRVVCQCSNAWNAPQLRCAESKRAVVHHSSTDEVRCRTGMSNSETPTLANDDMDEERKRSGSLASTTALSHQLSLSALPDELAKRLDLVDQVRFVARRDALLSMPGDTIQQQCNPPRIVQWLTQSTGSLYCSLCRIELHNCTNDLAVLLR